jgi:hypothetical protein
MHDFAVCFGARTQDRFGGVASLRAFWEKALVAWRKRLAVVWLAHVQLNTYRILEENAKVVVTIIEIRPFRNGWQVYECVGVQPVFLSQEQAIDYATGRACFRSGEIRVLDSSGNVERIIAGW